MLHTEKTIYEIAKAESVDIIHSQIHHSRLNLLEGYITAQAM